MINEAAMIDEAAKGLFHRIDEKNPPTEFIGGIFPRKHVSIIASKSGVGKTWYILKLITDLSNGGTIFITQSYYEEPAKSLLFCGETGIQLLTERQEMMHDKANPEKIAIVSKLEAARNGYFLNLNKKEGAETLSFLVKQFEPDLIILDTLMSFRDDNENEAKDTSMMIQRLQALAEKTNTAIIATHHLRKADGKSGNQKFDQDEIIGSSALVRLVGTAFILSKTGLTNYVLKPVKTWWGNSEPIYYRMFEKNEEIFFEYGDSNDMTQKRMDAEKFIFSQPADTKLTARLIMDMFGLPKATVYRILDKFAEKVEGTTYYHRKRDLFS